MTKQNEEADLQKITYLTKTRLFDDLSKESSKIKNMKFDNLSNGKEIVMQIFKKQKMKQKKQKMNQAFKKLMISSNKLMKIVIMKKQIRK